MSILGKTKGDRHPTPVGRVGGEVLSAPPAGTVRECRLALTSMPNPFPTDAFRAVENEAPRIARRYRVESDELAHRVIEKFVDHRRTCLRPVCRTCEGQAEPRFVKRSLKNEALDMIREAKQRTARENRAARPETSTAPDPSAALEQHETEELLKYTAAELGRLRERDRMWYEAFLLSSLGRSHREIAAILSLSEPNSQQHVSRARKFLHDERRNRLLARAMLAVVAIGVSVPFLLPPRREARLAVIPLRGMELSATPLEAHRLPRTPLQSVENLVSTPLRGG